MSREELFESAADYDRMLEEGLKLSGESKEYFARRRVDAVRRHLGAVVIRRILDFGCGTGETTPLLSDAFEADAVTGLDTAADAVREARRTVARPNIHFCGLADFQSRDPFDLCYTNGVFHHIPPEKRAEAMRLVHTALRPGGWFAFFENNPWNPGTRMVMRRIPFDQDAVTISPPEAARTLEAHGFNIATRRSFFYFPRALRCLRPLERPLGLLPLGGQYLILCQKRG